MSDINNRIAQLIGSTADYIGSDGECGNLTEFAEMVLDADRIESNCKDSGWKPGDREAVDMLRAMPWEVQMKLAKKILR